MSDAPSAADQFWLLTSSTPTGPYTIAQVHAELAAGRATWQTPACPVGGTGWQPLVHTPGVGPVARGSAPPLPTPPAPSPVSPPAPAPAPQPSTKPRGQNPEWPAIVVGVIVAAVVLHLAYDIIRPLTPREVADRVGRCKTVEEAKPYCTTAFYPVLVALDALDDHTSGDEDFTLTDDGSGTGQDYLIGFKFTVFDPGQARRVPIAGFITLKKSDGWKVADMAFSTFDGQPTPEPISLVKNGKEILDELRKNRSSSGGPASGGAKSSDADRRTRTGVIMAAWAFVKAGGAKSVGVIVLAALGAIYAAVKSKKKA